MKHKYGALIERYCQGKTEEYLCSALIIREGGGLVKKKIFYNFMFMEF
jgi:hypothetical protein